MRLVAALLLVFCGGCARHALTTVHTDTSDQSSDNQHFDATAWATGDETERHDLRTDPIERDTSITLTVEASPRRPARTYTKRIHEVVGPTVAVATRENKTASTTVAAGTDNTKHDDHAKGGAELEKDSKPALSCAMASSIVGVAVLAGLAALVRYLWKSGKLPWLL